MYEKLVIIDKMGHKPIYEQIVEQIQNLIVTEVLKPDEMIPSVRNLSRECGTNPNTVQKAYNELERVGITYSVPGVGRYVSNNAKEIVQKLMSTSNSELKIIVEKLKLSGMTIEEIIHKVKLFYGGEKMIEVKNVTKKFDDFIALKNMNCEISEGCIYGLVGSNGAGKSTFLRLVTGIYKPDEGEIKIDQKTVWENQETKSNFVFVPDELYFTSQATLNKMSKLYNACYPNFSFERYKMLVDKFGLDPKKKIAGFSKGMKRQAAIICALSCQTKYLFFDETFDELDPVMRNLVKNLIFDDICERQATAVITSHSLRELEDTCDQLTLLHKGGVIFESDVQNLKTSLFKIQAAFNIDYDKNLFTNNGIEVLDFKKTGVVSNSIIRGDKDKVIEILSGFNPIILDVLPLSLEEVFVFEMGEMGYKFEDVFEKEEEKDEKK